MLGDTDYQFPASGLDAGRYVTVLQAELRAIASQLVMPEFMLTSDASNANYASTMVAEGPAMRRVARETPVRPAAPRTPGVSPVSLTLWIWPDTLRS